MRVGVLNDFNMDQRAGGANRAIKLYLQAAPESEEIIFCTPGNVDRECDYYILFLTKRFSEEELGFVQARRYFWSGFDWWPDEDGNSKWRNLMVKKARVAFFVSPLHLQRFCDLYNAKPANPLVLPPPLDLANLSNTARPEERNGRALWAGEWHPAKGLDLAAYTAKRLQIHMDMFSPSMPAEALRSQNIVTPFAHPGGFVPEEGWYETMAKYSMLIHTPRVPDAFGYIVLEAYALGLKVHLSGRSGVESYLEEDLGVVLQMCGESAKIFWDTIIELR